MVIHIATATPISQEQMITLRRIMSVAHKTGHVLAYDWIEPYYARQNAGATPEPANQFNSHLLNAVERCDLFIADISAGSTGVGFQIATALQKKKPAFILCRADATPDEFIQGLDDTLAIHATYNETNLEDITEQFIQENMVNTKDLRFNFVIDRQIYNHLRWKSFKSGKTKAEVVRDLLLKDLNSSDD